MKVELAHRLNSAVARVDTAATNLSIACGSGSDDSIGACGDEYVKAINERNEAFDAAEADAEDGS